MSELIGLVPAPACNGSTIDGEHKDTEPTSSLLANRNRNWCSMTPVSEEKPAIIPTKAEDSAPKPTTNRHNSVGTAGSEIFGHRGSAASMASMGSMQSMESTEQRLGIKAYHPQRLAQQLKDHWRQFTLFGINTEDSTPRVWGNRVKSNRRKGSHIQTLGGSGNENKQQKALSKMVDRHNYADEMRLQLRDQRIPLSYLDVFEVDGLRGTAWLVRVFSLGATILEYIKILAGMWTFFVSLMVVSFWKVLMLHEDETPTFLVADLSLDCIYAICLAVQLRTTILDVHTGRECCDGKQIWRSNVANHRFWFDVVSCVPLILLYWSTGNATLTRYVALLKVLRGWRIGRTPPEHRFVPSTTFQLFQLCGFIAMGGHLLACVWFLLVHDQEKTMMQHVPGNNQAYQSCLEAGRRGCWWRLYTVSINQGIYLLMGIECNAYSALEHFFVTVCAPVGALVHAYMLGKIILLIQRMGALETKQNEHTMAVQEAMRILGLEPFLQMRIVTFFTYERIHRSGRLFTELFTDLSPQLRFELQLHLYLDLVGKSRLFMKTKPRVIREIVVSLNDLIFLPGDWVCRYGDYGDSMYFIVSGECSVIHQDTVTELKQLKTSAYFGEVALLTGVPRTASVRANKFCIMAHLTKDSFAPIVQKWPEEMDVLLVGVAREDRKKIKLEAARHFNIVLPSQSISRRGSMRSSTSGEAVSHRSSSGRRASPRQHHGPDVAPAPPPPHEVDNKTEVAKVSVPEPKLVHEIPDIPGVPTTPGFVHTSTDDSTTVGAMAPLPELQAAQPSIGRTVSEPPISKTSSKSGFSKWESNLIEEENRTLERVQSQLSHVAAHIVRLQTEVLDQRSLLAHSLAEVRQWAVQATREAMVRQLDPTMMGRRGSMDSAMSCDEGLEFAAPFT